MTRTSTVQLLQLPGCLYAILFENFNDVSNMQRLTRTDSLSDNALAPGRYQALRNFSSREQ